MCYRILYSPAQSHDWLAHSEHESLLGALAALDSLIHGHTCGRWTVRNIRGELIAKATIGSVSTFWLNDQLVLAS